LHQFDKVEIVHLEHPNKSYETLESMSQYVQGLLQKLGLHYRVLLLCGGDTGFASAMTYDMEVWSAAQERWLEVSSVSNFEIGSFFTFSKKHGATNNFVPLHFSRMAAVNAKSPCDATLGTSKFATTDDSGATV